MFYYGTEVETWLPKEIRINCLGHVERLALSTAQLLGDDVGGNERNGTED